MKKLLEKFKGLFKRGKKPTAEELIAQTEEQKYEMLKKMRLCNRLIANSEASIKTFQTKLSQNPNDAFVKRTVTAYIQREVARKKIYTWAVTMMDVAVANLSQAIQKYRMVGDVDLFGDLAMKELSKLVNLDDFVNVVQTSDRFEDILGRFEDITQEFEYSGNLKDEVSSETQRYIDEAFAQNAKGTEPTPTEKVAPKKESSLSEDKLNEIRNKL